MSIINDALKKTRREGNPTGQTPVNDDTVIRPRERASSGPGTWMIVSAILVVIVFIALVAGLGYFAYTQYFRATESEATAPPPASEESAKAAEPESAPPKELEIMELQEKPSVRPPSKPENLRAEEPPPPPVKNVQTAPPSSPVVIPATAEILSEFSVNGVMRGGSSVRVITSSGVYQVGDEVSSPRGFRIQAIEEDFLLLRAPDGNSHQIPLP